MNGDETKLNQIGVVADVMENFVYSTQRRANEVSFSSAIQYVSSLTVQIVSTSDKSLPSNLKLEIFGCYSPVNKLSTKAQIEQSESFSRSLSLFPYSFFS